MAVHLGFQRVELLEVGGGIGLIGLLAGRIGGAEAVPDVRYVNLGIGDALPGMGIDAAVAVSMRGFLDRPDAFRGLDQEPPCRPRI